LKLTSLIRWSKKRSVDKTQAVPGATGSTALHVGCANGCVKVVDLLIRNGARVDVKDKYGSTPLDVARAKHESEIVKILKQAKEKQKSKRQKTRASSCIMEESKSKIRKSVDGTLLTHNRTGSDKELRMRRPSLPSIFEDHQPFPIPNIMTKTSSSSTKNSLEVTPVSRRSFSLAHRPSLDELYPVHSCPVSPRSSTDLIKRPYRNSNSCRSPRSSDDSSAMAYSSLPHISVCYPTDDWAFLASDQLQRDWYGHGVVNPYDDENYLLSLERRAFNVGSNKNRDVEKPLQGFAKRSGDESIYHRRLSAGPHSTATAIVIDDNIQLSQDPGKCNDLADSGFSGQQLRTTALKNAMAASSAVSLSTSESLSPSSIFEEESYDGEDDDEDVEESEEKAYNSEPLPRSSLMLDNESDTDMIRRRILRQERQERPHSASQEVIHTAAEAKKRWFSTVGFSKYNNGRHSFDNSRKSLDHLRTQFAKRGISNPASSPDEADSSDEISPSLHQHQKTSGFFSRWTPVWGRKL
jgi:hypothetical protein